MKKISCLLLVLAIFLSCFVYLPGFTVFAETASKIEAAAKAYVAANGNNGTAAGLLTAVQAVEPGATLDTANDYYFKHAVPGVKDDTVDYPLDIPGSDGALVAVFAVSGTRYPVAVPLAHETEIIHITETAVVGTSAGFSYSGGDVIGYSGSADKIVIPDAYTGGSIAHFADLSTVQQVKVVIVNNRIYLRDNAFENWDGLIAFQMAANTPETAWNVFANPNDINAQFQNCDNLKYVKLPDWINTPSWASAPFAGYLFNGCASLENIVIPNVYKVAGSTAADKTAPMNYHVFTNNRVRDYVFPAKHILNGILDGIGNLIGSGNRNVHWYTDAMTTPRAVALAIAKGSELVRDSLTGSELVDGMLAAITGSADAATVAAGITAVAVDAFAVQVTAGDDSFEFSFGEPRTYDDLPTAVKTAADAYVKTQQNAATAAGLLAAVRAVDSELTLDTANDFYIKHAVPGVTDDTNDYPLNIAGSDGAVAAVFCKNNVGYGYSCAFAHETETIHISETAIVGTSTGFTYDGNGNVTAYSGTAEKMVFPAGYAGTMTNLADKTAVQNVKVLIYNNGVAFKGNAFNNWDGLIAVQINNGTSSLQLASAREAHMFSQNDNLTYFQFPQKINNGYYWNAMFPDSFLENCPKLENLVMPETATSGSYTIYGYHPFYGTAVRDAIYPNYSKAVTESNEPFGGTTVNTGTRNIHFYSDSMTFVRAAALAASAIYEIPAGASAGEIASAARDAVAGCADAENFKTGLSFTQIGEGNENQDLVSFDFCLEKGEQALPVWYRASKTLRSLTCDYALSQPFDPTVKEYGVIVPTEVSEITLKAEAAVGAQLISITGNTNLREGDNTVLISGVSSEGLPFVYRINAERISRTRNLLDGALTQAVTIQPNNGYTSPDVFRLLKTDTNYEISYSYTGSVTLSVGNWEAAPASTATENGTTYARTVFHTPVSFTNISTVCLLFTGTGTLSSLSLNEIALELTVLEGAGVRLQEPDGLRFRTRVTGTEYYNEKADLSFGTILCPTDELTMGAFTEEALQAAGKPYLNIEQSVWDEQDDTVFNVVLSHLKEKNMSRTFSAVSYADLAYPDGTAIRIYSEYEPTLHSRSDYQAVKTALSGSGYTQTERAQLNQIKQTAEGNPNMYVKLGTDSLGPKAWIVGKYNSSYDMVMVLRRMGGNNIFNISSPLKIANSSNTISNDLDSATQLIADTLNSDWFGPHKIYAVNNADGDNKGSGGYCGGAHNYNNNENPADASATGRSANVRVVINGTSYTSFAGYANEMDLYWDTYVQAGNTIKADGSGREVLLEHHHMKYDGTLFLTDTTFEFLEDVKWVQHYGMQCINGNSWNGEIRYDNGSWQSIASSDSNSGNRYTEMMTMRKNGHYLEMYLDSGYDLGDRRYLSPSNTSGAFSRKYSGFGKSYFYLVNSTDTFMQAGQTVSYRGHYRFYSAD